MTRSRAGALKTSVPTELRLLGQYIKNLSFESPHAPTFLEPESLGENTELRADVNVSVAPQTKDTHEVTLSLEIQAKSNAGIIYHLELAYAGLFRIGNVPLNRQQTLLRVDCPKILFPDLRRVVSDITHDAGFPPLMLDIGKLTGLALGKSSFAKRED